MSFEPPNARIADQMLSHSGEVTENDAITGQSSTATDAGISAIAGQSSSAVDESKSILIAYLLLLN